MNGLLYCSSAMGLRGSENKLQFRVKTTVPHQKRWKKCHFRPIRAVFQRFWWGTVVLTLNCSFSLSNHRSMAELQFYYWVFWNFSVGPRSIYAFVGFESGRGPKLGREIPKRGAEILPPENIDYAQLDISNLTHRASRDLAQRLLISGTFTSVKTH